MGLLRNGIFGKKYGSVEIHKADNSFAANNIRNQLKAQGYGNIIIKKQQSFLISGRKPLKPKRKNNG